LAYGLGKHFVFLGAHAGGFRKHYVKAKTILYICTIGPTCYFLKFLDYVK
jgi:hypothetical protein